MRTKKMCLNQDCHRHKDFGDRRPKKKKEISANTETTTKMDNASKLYKRARKERKKNERINGALERSIEIFSFVPE